MDGQDVKVVDGVASNIAMPDGSRGIWAARLGRQKKGSEERIGAEDLAAFQLRIQQVLDKARDKSCSSPHCDTSRKDARHAAPPPERSSAPGSPLVHSDGSNVCARQVPAAGGGGVARHILDFLGRGSKPPRSCVEVLARGGS